MSHWHPLRFREKIVLRTSRMSTSRGRPPRGLCLAGGIIGSTMAHGSSVRSEGYTFRERPSCSIYAHSSAEGICANYLTNLLFCQVLFPDSLLEPFGITRYYTDGWGAYERHVEAEKHTVGKANTQKIESKHINLRTRIKRLVRRTICFSKTKQMHDLVIGLFINRHEFGRAV